MVPIETPEDQIPEDWLDLIDKDEYYEEVTMVTQALVERLSEYFNLPKPSQDLVILALKDLWDKSFEATFDILKSIIKYKTVIGLFDRHWGHLFPRNEDGDLILTPDVIALAHNKAEAEVREAIERNKEELKEAGLLYEWLDIDADFMN